MGLESQISPSAAWNAKASARLTPPQAALDGQLKNTGQFVIIQDTGGTSHSETSGSIKENPLNSLSFLAEPLTASVLARNGFKNLAMEIRHEFQPLADKVAAGKMNPAQYAQAKADMYRAAGDIPGSMPSPRSLEEAKVIQSMARAGIKVLCVENQDADLKKHGESADRIDSLSASMEDMQVSELGVSGMLSAFKLAAKDKISQMTDGHLYKNSPQERTRFLEAQKIQAVTGEFRPLAEMHKIEMERRMASDSTLAATIRQKVGAEKTAVYYGSAHGSLNYDLDEILGNAKMIGMVPSENSLKARVQSLYMNNYERPDVAITLDKGQTFSTSQIEGMIQKDAPRMPADLTPTIKKP